MNADSFRQLYDYHFTVNHRIWDKCIGPLTDEQFTRDLAYSHGSLQRQFVHLMSVDERWFSGLRGLPVPAFLNPDSYPDRPAVRAYWDGVEAQMRGYLETLTDSQVFTPYDDLQVWQVLLHVANHGTDHRAQILALVHQLGGVTFPQDLAYHFFEMDPSQPDEG